MFITELRRDFTIPHVEAIHLNPGPDVCKARVRERRNHPNLQGPDGDAVIDSFLRGYAAPEPFEGFTSIITAVTDDEVENIFKVYRERFPQVIALPAKAFK